MKARRRREEAAEDLSTRVDKLTAAEKSGIPEGIADAQEALLEERATKVVLMREWKRARQQRAALARGDVNEFCAFVGKDAETGLRVRQEQIHELFHHKADTEKRLLVMAHPESGKTTQLGILRPLYLLGRNHNLRIAVISKTEPNATKTTRAMRSYIEKSNELAEVFPELLPGDKWGEESFTVRRTVHSRDPSVQALGLNGTVIGSRVDVMIFDDVLDHENTSTNAERKKTLKRIRAGFLDRLSKDGVAIFLTNAWHPEDAAHVLEKEGWPIVKVPVVDEDGNPSWPEKWPEERIAEARRDLGPLEFARAHLCKARDEGESPFDEASIKAATAAASHLELVYSLRSFTLPPGWMVFHGVDLAVTKTTKSNLTSIVSVLLAPDGSRQLLWVESGRWSSREIRDRVLDADRRYGGAFIVENNAAQRWIFDIIQNQDDLPEAERRWPTLVPFTTGKNKAHPAFGVEGLAVELTNGMWLLPDDGPAKAVKEVEELKGEALYYVRGAHTGDRLMAWWFAREGCRKWARRDDDKAEDKDLDPHGHAPSPVPRTPADPVPGGQVLVVEAAANDDSMATPLADLFR